MHESIRSADLRVCEWIESADGRYHLPTQGRFRLTHLADPVLAMRTGLNQRVLRASALAKLGISTVLAGFSSLALTFPCQAKWDLNTTWEIEKQLQAFIKELPGGQSVQPPRLFLYRGVSYTKDCIDQTESGISSPSYCPGDNTVYLEMGLGDELNQQFGDFGALSIVSHEFGHAYLIQTDQDHDGKQGELDADRFAGAFARYAESKKLLEPGDVQEAQKAFYSVGDEDVHSEDHHGLPQERLDAFNRGYSEGFVGQPGAESTTPAPTSTEPTPVPQVPVPAPAPTPQNEAVNPSGVVVALLVSILVVIALVGSVVALIRHSSDED